MTTISKRSYVDYFVQTYLRGYMTAGGSVIRAVVANDEDRRDVSELFERASKGSGYTFCRLDSAEARVQHLHEMFYAISKPFNWRSAVRRFLREVLKPEFELTSEDFTLRGLSEADGRQEYLLRREIDQLLNERLLRKEGLSAEFSRGVYAIVRGILYPQNVNDVDTAEAVINWFRGELLRISLVKPAAIYRKINKTTGRNMMTSLSRWSRSGNSAGIVVTLDLAAVTAPSGYRGRYTSSAAMDVFEMIRQFIDAIDDIEGLALILLVDPSFADDEKRGIQRYPALAMRLGEDVSDLRKPLLDAPMVRVS